MAAEASQHRVKGGEIGALTGIRGVAALYVVVYHVREFERLLSPITSFLRHGYLAVDLFFVLSGFVMSLSYRHLFAKGFTQQNYRVFLIRRVARIYPLYLVATLLVLGASMTEPGYRLIDHWRQVIMNVLLVEAWGYGTPIDGPAWSISTEAAAYLLFPGLAALILYRKPIVGLLFAVICMAGLAAITNLHVPSFYMYPRQGPLDISWQKTPWPLVRCVCEFALGLVAFRLREFLPRRASLAWFVNILLVTLLFFYGTDLLAVAVMPFSLIALAQQNSLPARVLGSAPLLLLGRLSYAIYLIHFPLLALRQLAPLELVYFPTLFGLAWILYVSVEKPGRRFIRKFAH